MSKVYENELWWLEQDYAKPKIENAAEDLIEIHRNDFGIKQEIIMKDEIRSFWINLIDNPPKNRLIINGVHYTHEGMKIGVRKSWRGSNGKLFTIKMKDGTIIKTNSLWHQGKIPENYRHRLKDNAEFVND